jgi:hypothetical protein
MNWFRENPFLGKFTVATGLCTVIALVLLWLASGVADEAATRFNNTSMELRRLEGLAPYPSADNLRKMKAHTENYSSALNKLKDELKLRTPPPGPLAPNEFQTRLRVAMNAIAEKARANKVKLPEKFYLGFDEFASALPNEAAAPALGQELAQIEWLLNSILDAHVDAVTAFHRTPPSAERSPAPLPAATPGATPGAAKPVERDVVETTFFSTPGAARRVINQIAAANQQFCIIRVLHVRNEKEKGPAREVVAEQAAIPPAPTAKPTPAASLNFIVGNEKVETTARIEIVRFAL